MRLTRTVVSALKTRENRLHDCKTLKTMDENGCEAEKVPPYMLETEVKNCIRHVYESFDESNGSNGTGQVAKTKLQVLCATISRDIGVAYSAEDLSTYKEETKGLSCPTFIEYLEEVLLPRRRGEIDQHKIQKLCWTIVQQKFHKQDKHLLSEEEVFRQWLVFNILDIDEVSRVHKEEFGLLLEKLVHIIGKVWDAKPLDEFCEEENMTFMQYLECLEKCYLTGMNKSIYQEGLEEIVDYVVHEVIKQGYLIKKGHMVKSMKDRWFVLKPGILSYYTNRNCNEKKGEIVISQDTKVVSVSDSRKYRFNVVCGGTKTHYDLEARDQRTKQEWMIAIQKAIDTTDGPSVQRKERLQRRLERNEKRLAKLEEEKKKREQENLMLAQQQELELLRQKYSDAEAQAILEAENLQEEIRRREELEGLHQELQNLLLAEKEAREAEATARALQEELLNDEKKRLEEVERMNAEKEKLLEEELKKRESLEERQKLQDKLLEEERQRFERLEKEREAAQQAMQEAHDKLAAAQEASRKAAEEAKKKAREIKTCTGLARPIGPHDPAFITHRGQGAFCKSDFDKLAKHHEKIPPKTKPKPKRATGNNEEERGEENGNGDVPTEITEMTDQQVSENTHEEAYDQPEVLSDDGDKESTVVQEDSENAVSEQKDAVNAEEQNKETSDEDKNQSEGIIENLEKPDVDQEERAPEEKTSETKAIGSYDSSVKVDVPSNITKEVNGENEDGPDKEETTECQIIEQDSVSKVKEAEGATGSDVDDKKHNENPEEATCEDVSLKSDQADQLEQNSDDKEEPVGNEEHATEESSPEEKALEAKTTASDDSNPRFLTKEVNGESKDGPNKEESTECQVKEHDSVSEVREAEGTTGSDVDDKKHDETPEETTCEDVSLKSEQSEQSSDDKEAPSGNEEPATEERLGMKE